MLMEIDFKIYENSYLINVDAWRYHIPMRHVLDKLNFTEMIIR